MSTRPLPSVDTLLAPVSSDQPCGEDMSFSGEFDTIQEARREDDASLDQGEWVAQIKEADWPRVLDIAETLFTSRTKDLRLAIWYTEAASKLHGVAGLADGFTLMGGLFERYWDTVHPLPEDNDFEQRIGNLSLFIKRALELIRTLPLVRGKGQAWGLLVLDGARALQPLLDRGDEAAQGANRVSLQQFRDAQRATPRSFYQQATPECVRCTDALDALSRVADERLGMDGPSFTALKSALEEYVSTIARLTRENGVVDSSALGDNSTDSDEAGTQISPDTTDAATPAGPHASGPIRNREQALQQLRIVAEFFRRTEPHSPVAYLADKAARWGEMPLHVWLKAVLKEDGALARFEDLLGMDEQPEQD
ncbi:type VI secretion system protein TssA [Viridibacterium curvum]|uniref:Type VI secretion system protein TssA n=1 Tax=Viridibacterium curvum TaxID=1101404 RepID=A0ABP9QJ88_9RHOO